MQGVQHRCVRTCWPSIEQICQEHEIQSAYQRNQWYARNRLHRAAEGKRTSFVAVQPGSQMPHPSWQQNKAPGWIAKSTAKAWIRHWATSLAFKLFAYTWSLTNLCWTFHWLCTYNTKIVRASPNRVLPSKTAVHSLATVSSVFKVSFSFARTEGTNSLKWPCKVSLCPYF